MKQDTAREIVLRYAGFVMIACSVVLGEMLVRLDEVFSRANASR